MNRRNEMNDGSTAVAPGRVFVSSVRLETLVKYCVARNEHAKIIPILDLQLLEIVLTVVQDEENCQTMDSAEQQRFGDLNSAVRNRLEKEEHIDVDHVFDLIENWERVMDKFDERGVNINGLKKIVEEYMAGKRVLACSKLCERSENFTVFPHTLHDARSRSSRHYSFQELTLDETRQILETDETCEYRNFTLSFLDLFDALTGKEEEDGGTFMSKLMCGTSASVTVRFSEKQLKAVDWLEVVIRKDSENTESGLEELLVSNEQCSDADVIAKGPEQDLYVFWDLVEKLVAGAEDAVAGEEASE